MAGQPPEPSFQPNGQEQNLTQGRPAWQQSQSQPPSTPYTPPGGNSRPGYGAQEQQTYVGQPGQAYPPPPPPPGPGYGAGNQDQAYAAQPGQGYGAGQDQVYNAGGQAYAARGQEQAYSAQDQPYAQPGQNPDYQGYQGYQPNYAQPDPGQGQDQGKDAGSSRWQGLAGMKPATQPKQHGEKGFLGSLFDFSFSSFVTPKIVKVLYILLVIWTALIGISLLVGGFKIGGLSGGLFTLIIIEPIFILLTLGIYRVVLEAFMVVFRIYEETKKISDRAGSGAGGSGD